MWRNNTWLRELKGFHIPPSNHSFIHATIHLSTFHSFIHLPIRGVNDRLCSFIHKFIHSFLPSCPPFFILSFIHSFLHSLLHSFVASFVDSSIPSFITRKLTQRCGEAMFDWENWKVFTYRRKSLFTLRKLIPLKDAWIDKWCEHKLEVFHSSSKVTNKNNFKNKKTKSIICAQLED